MSGGPSPPPERPPGQIRTDRVRGRIAVAVGLVALLVLIRVSAPAEIDLADALQDMITLSVSVIIESLPFVFLGIGLSVAVQVWIPSGYC